MSSREGLPERLGKTVNELDIDFSRFTIVGWLMVIATLGLGVAVGWLLYGMMTPRGPMDRAPALVPPLAGFAVTVGTFLLFRAILQWAGLPVTKPPRTPEPAPGKMRPTGNIEESS